MAKWQKAIPFFSKELVSTNVKEVICADDQIRGYNDFGRLVFALHETQSSEILFYQLEDVFYFGTAGYCIFENTFTKAAITVIIGDQSTSLSISYSNTMEIDSRLVWPNGILNSYTKLLDGDEVDLCLKIHPVIGRDEIRNFWSNRFRSFSLETGKA